MKWPWRRRQPEDRMADLQQALARALADVTAARSALDQATAAYVDVAVHELAAAEARVSALLREIRLLDMLERAA